MRRGGYYTSRQNSGWDTTSQDYHTHIARMERMPTRIPDAPQYPSVHRAFNNKCEFEEEEVEFHEEGQFQLRKQQHQHSPKSHKKVQMAEHVETFEETWDESNECHEETTVDVEADSYIQQKRKAFELCKWKTFKV